MLRPEQRAPPQTVPMLRHRHLLRTVPRAHHRPPHLPGPRRSTQPRRAGGVPAPQRRRPRQGPHRPRWAHRPRALSLDQANALLDAASDHRLYALVHLPAARHAPMRTAQPALARHRPRRRHPHHPPNPATPRRCRQHLHPAQNPTSKRTITLTEPAIAILEHHRRRQNREKRPSPAHAGTKPALSSPPATASHSTPTARPPSSTASAPSLSSPTSASTTSDTPQRPSYARRAPNSTSSPVPSATPTSTRGHSSIIDCHILAARPTDPRQKYHRVRRGTSDSVHIRAAHRPCA